MTTWASQDGPPPPPGSRGRLWHDGGGENFTRWLEPWCSGFLAAREGLSGDDGEEFMRAACAAFEGSGGERAKRVADLLAGAEGGSLSPAVSSSGLDWEARVEALIADVQHVLAVGQLGKQSKARLKESLARVRAAGFGDGQEPEEKTT